MADEVDDFLAHYGVKGMKWGRRRASSSVETSSSGGGSSSAPAAEKKRMSPETKRKLKIGAGIVGAAAVIAVGAYAANKHMDANKIQKLSEMRKQVETRRNGENAAKKTLNSYNQKANWKPSTYSKANRDGKRSATAEVQKYEAANAARRQAFADRVNANQAVRDQRQRRVNSITRSGREKNREADLENTRRQINKFAQKSKWELASEKAPKRSGLYSAKDAQKDVKLYGDKGQARIQKQVDKGTNLSSARQREATRQNGAQAVKLALNIRQAQRKEGADYERLRRQSGR